MQRFYLIFVVIFITCSVTMIRTESVTEISSLFEFPKQPPVQLYPPTKKALSGFEGYSIPTYPEYVPKKSHIDSVDNDKLTSGVEQNYNEVQFGTWSSNMAKSLVPLSNSALSFVVKAIYFVFKALLIAIISFSITVLTCTFTPICSLNTEKLGINKTMISELATPYMTADNLNKSTVLIGRAIDSFSQLQNDTENNSKSDEFISRGDIDSVKKITRRRRRR